MGLWGCLGIIWIDSREEGGCRSALGCVALIWWIFLVRKLLANERRVGAVWICILPGNALCRDDREGRKVGDMVLWPWRYGSFMWAFPRGRDCESGQPEEPMLGHDPKHETFVTALVLENRNGTKAGAGQLWVAGAHCGRTWRPHSSFLVSHSRQHYWWTIENMRNCWATCCNLGQGARARLTLGSTNTWEKEHRVERGMSLEATVNPNC